MQILVTGGAGYIGSHIVKQLTAAGHEVIVYDNLITGYADALLAGEKLVIADIADQVALENTFKNHSVEVVIHLAAATSVPNSVQQPLYYYANNTVNTLQLLRMCQTYQVENFIFSSTASVYGALEQKFSEDSAVKPANPYGRSKLMSEYIIANAARQQSLHYVIFRYFNVAGADPLSRLGQRSPEANHLIKMCSQAALRLRDQVVIYGTDYPTTDGTGIRDYVHVEDIASAHIAALDYLVQQKPSITLNIGYGKGSSVREVINTAKKVTGVDFAVVEAARRAGDPAILVANTERISKTLDWTPQYDDLETIIADAWHWEKTLWKN